MKTVLSLLVYTSLAQPEPASGFVDLHVHPLTEQAFGGAWLHGSVFGDEALAMAGCDGGHDHARAGLGWLDALIGRLPGSPGDTGAHPQRTKGYPSYDGWPRWDTIAHQQAWWGHLKKAHEAGLSLMVASAVNFEPLCELMPEENRKYACDDFETVLRQLYSLRALAARHASWMEIAYSPADARRIISEKKLAIVLSVEASFAFEGPDWEYKFRRYVDAGARTFQIVHQLDNQMGGSARHNPMFRFLQWLLDVKRTPGIAAWASPRRGFQYDGEKNNIRGLSPPGKALVKQMMQEGFPVDIAHLSLQGVRDVQALSREAKGFPFYVSHGHFRDMMDDGKFSTWEKSSPRWVLEAIRDSGGMFGLRTGPEKTRAYVPTVGGKNPVPNDCGGSTRSFAQTYQYGVREVGVPVALATDLNGFIQQLRPRFGNPEETCGATPVTAAEKALSQKAQTRPLGRSFDQTGLGHIGQAGDVWEELKNFGVDVSAAWTTTEQYLRMWEKAQALSKPETRPPAGVE